MGIDKLLLYVLSFVALSFGSSLIVSTITAFTKRIKLPPFTFSFFVLGALTSITELAVGINALEADQPEIFVGSLVGGTLAIFLVVIPLLAIIKGKVPIQKHLSQKKLLLVLFIATMPAFITLDQRVTRLESLSLIALYILLFSVVRSRKGSLLKMVQAFKTEPKNLKDNTLLKLALGGLLIFLSSRFIVHQTIVYSEHFHMSPFWASLIIIAIGSTLPELALAVHAGKSPRKSGTDEAVIGDFLGSAAMNVALFGIFALVFTVMHGPLPVIKDFTVIYLFTTLAVASFLLLAQGKSISRREGIALFALYICFVGAQAAVTA
jgi:cation:H+ antiporter